MSSLQATTLRPGDVVPHFEVNVWGGGRVAYAAIWQQQNLVLVTLPEASRESEYAVALGRRAPDFQVRDCACVVTEERVQGLPAPGLLIADQWGEIVHVAVAAEVGKLPAADAILEWIDYIRQRCPECEGEAR